MTSTKVVKLQLVATRQSAGLNFKSVINVLT